MIKIVAGFTGLVPAHPRWSHFNSCTLCSPLFAIRRSYEKKKKAVFY